MEKIKAEPLKTMVIERRPNQPNRSFASWPERCNAK